MFYKGRSPSACHITLRCSTKGGLPELREKSLYQWEGKGENSSCSFQAGEQREGGNILDMPAPGALWWHELQQGHTRVQLSPCPVSPGGECQVLSDQFYLAPRLSPFQPHCDSVSSRRLLTPDHLQCPGGKYNDSLLLVNEASKH